MQDSPPKKSWLTSLLRWNARTICRHRRAFLVGGILLVLFSAWFTWRYLGFKTSSTDLIGADNETHQRQLAYQDEFRQSEDFVVLFQSENPERNIEAVEALAAAVRQEPLLVDPTGSNLLYKADTEHLRKFGLFYLSEADLEGIEQILKTAIDFGTDGQVTVTRTLQAISDRLEPGRQSGDAGTVEFLPQFLGALEKALATGQIELDPALLFGSAADMEEESGYLTFEDGRAVLLLITPLQTERSDPAISDVIPLLREKIDAVRQTFPEVRIGLTGEPVLSADEESTYQGDTTLALGITVAVVFLIFAYAYRQVMRPLLKIAVLLSAIVVALAFTAATVGHLNILSVAFIVMILGLGDDFAIYMITRFEEERAGGKEPAEAMEAAMVQAGHAVVMASLTVAISFLTMTFTGFVGLSEMGIIASGGILLCALLCLTFLPALLLCQRRERQNARHEIRHHLTPRLIAAEQWWLRHAGAVIGVSLALVLVATLVSVRFTAIPAGFSRLEQGEPVQKAFGPVLRVPFQYDLLDMQNPELESVQTVRALSELQSIYFSVIVVDSLAEVRRLTRELAAQPSVGSVVSILGSTDRGTPTLPADQEAKQPLVQSIVETARRIEIEPTAQVDPAAFSALLPTLEARLTRMARLVRAMAETQLADQLDAAARALQRIEETLPNLSETEIRDRLGEFQLAFGQLLQEAFSELAGMQERPLTLEDLPASLSERYIGKTGKFLIEVYPAGDLREKARLEAFSREVLAVTADATGTPIELNIFVDLLKVSYMKAALYALIFVALLVGFYFRSWLPTVLCLMPLFCGILLMLGFMRMTGLAFNLANIITLPLIIGIGVDNGILILQRFRHEPDIALFPRNTGRAILMSNLSTIAGFAALSLANHQGIASLGLIMTIGVGATMVVSLITLPAMIHLLKIRKVRI